MAEFAKLGIDIDASSATTAATAMRKFGDTAADAATRAQRGVRSFDQALTSLRAREKAKDAALIESALGRTGDAAQKAHQKAQGLPTALTLITHELGLLGPAGSVAAQGLNALLMGFGPIGIAVGVFGAFLGWLTSRITDAKNAVKEWKAVQDADIDRKQGLVKVNEDLETNIRLLQSADSETEQVKIKYEELSKQARGSIVLEENAAKQRDLQLKKIADARLEIAAREQQQAINRVNTAQLANAALGQTGEALRQVQLAQQLYNLEIDESLRKLPAQQQALQQLAVSASSYKGALDLIRSGEQALSAAQSQFGVGVPSTRTESQLRSGTTFFGLTEALDREKVPFEQKITAFANFAQQALEQGIPDISGLLIKSGFSSKQVNDLLSGLKQQFGDDLYNQVVKTTEGFKGFWLTAESQVVKATESAATFGQRLDLIDKSITAIKDQVATPLALSLDNSQALTAAQQVQQQLDAIPDVTYKQVIIQTYASGSPTLPVSDYFGSYLPDKIGEVGELSPEITLSVQDYEKRKRDIIDLGQQINAMQSRALDARTGLGGYGQTQLFGEGAFASRAATEEALSLQRQRRDLVDSLNADVLRAQQSTGGSISPVASSGGGSIITLDLRGASINYEILDRVLLPKFEAMIKDATGKDVSYRVLN